MKRGLLHFVKLWDGGTLPLESVRHIYPHRCVGYFIHLPEILSEIPFNFNLDIIDLPVPLIFLELLHVPLVHPEGLYQMLLIITILIFLSSGCPTINVERTARAPFLQSPLMSLLLLFLFHNYFEFI